MIQDQHIRQQARDPAKSFIVQAPAGSGKTELLVQRFITLLRVVKEPEAILAITFTRKAAKEMQQRVLQYLLTEEHILADQEMLTKIVQQPNCLRIQTIDSFCQQLVRQAPFKTAVLPGMEISNQPEPLYEQAARESLLHLLSSQASSQTKNQRLLKLLLCFDNDLTLLQKLLVPMLAQREQWLILGLHRGAQYQAWLHLIGQTWQQLIQERLAAITACFCAHDLVLLVQLAHFSCRNLPAADWDYLASIPLASVQAKDTAIHTDSKFWRAIAFFLLTKQKQWRKTMTKKEGFPPEAQAEKQQFQALLQQFSSRDDAENLAGLLKEMLILPDIDTATRQNDPELIQQIIDLLVQATAILQLLFTAQNQVDYSQFLLAAIQLLEQDSYWVEKRSAMVQHILVDEFQDTSVSQFYLLEQLMRSWDSSTNVSLFLVGDPMQSIYRFRQADVSLFLRIWHQQIQLPVPLQPLQLNVNFRSAPVIVHWINHVFQRLLPTQPDMNLAAVPYSPSTARAQATPSDANITTTYVAQVCCHAFVQEQQQQEKIAALIKAAVATQQTTAILVRSRRHLVQLLPYLEQQQISYEAVELTTLADQMFIRDMMQLLRVIYDPTDRLAWFCLLRCPWIGLQLHALHHIALLDQQPWQALLQIIAQPERYQHLSKQPHRQSHQPSHYPSHPQKDSGIDASAYQRIYLVYRVINQALHRRFKSSWSELLLNAWRQLGGYLHLSMQQLQQVEQLLSLLDQHSAHMQLDITAIEKYLQQTRLDQMHEYHGSEDHDADLAVQQEPKRAHWVQVMTIHRAKGLEFDQVIIPNVHMQSGNVDPELLLFAPCHFPDQQNQQHNMGLLFALNQPVTYATDRQNVYHYMRYREKLQQDMEQDRLMYVAATRAKQQLHLLATLDKPDKILSHCPVHSTQNKTQKTQQKPWKPAAGSFLARLWPLLQEYFMVSLDISCRQNHQDQGEQVRHKADETHAQQDAAFAQTASYHCYHHDAVISCLLHQNFPDAKT